MDVSPDSRAEAPMISLCSKASWVLSNAAIGRP
jgi:hypothetical protein